MDSWFINERDLKRIMTFRRGSLAHKYFCLREFSRSEDRVLREAAELGMLQVLESMSESERDEVKRALASVPDPMAN